MIDINLIREKTEEITKALLKRMDNVDFTEVLELDDERKKLLFNIENLRNERNNVSKEIANLKKNKQDATSQIHSMKKVNDDVKELEEKLNDVKGKIKNILDYIPNIPDDDVPAGDKANNVVLRSWSKKPKFDFEQKNHVDLVISLGLIDYERGVKLGGNGFWMYTNEGAMLEWALLNFFVEEHLKDNYEFILPPHILINQCGYTAGQFPKFADDVFKIVNDEKGDSSNFLLPTAETALINIYRDEILKEEDLPKKFFAYTPCYRKEAGSYRANERGMIRGHQFNKIELFQYTTPDKSKDALEEMIAKAESLVQKLGLHYQVSKLAAKDCAGSMAKTLDIEIWIPSMDEYKEVSSASCANDYQARRGNIRYKNKTTKKNEYVHTLNASGLATSRILPAIVEQNQMKDGSIIVPEVLRKWINKEIIEPK